MTIIELLQKTYPETFPKVTKDRLIALQTTWHKQRTQLSRLKIISPDCLTAEEHLLLNELNEMQTACSDMIERATDAPINVYLLYSQCEDITKELRVKEWSNYLSNILVYEDNPLPVLMEMDEATSLEFAGLLLFLLRKNITPHAILHSGLLHRYFVINCITMNTIQEVYNLLYIAIHIDEPLYQTSREFLQLVAETRCSMGAAFKYYALNGDTGGCLHLIDATETLKETYKNCYVYDGKQLTYIDEKGNPKSIRINNRALFLTELQRAQSREGSAKRILKLSYEEIKQVVHASTGHKLPALPRAQVSKPSFACTVHPENLRNLYEAFGYPFFIRLLRLSSRDQNVVFKEFLVNTLQKMSAADLNELYKFIITQDVKYVVSLCSHPLFTPYLSQIYRYIFELFLANPTFSQGQERLIRMLRMYPETATWCKDALIEIQNTLSSAVEKNATPFTTDSYIDIHTVYSRGKTISDVLSIFGLETQDYPKGNYALQFFILRSLFKKNPAFDLVTWLDALYPTERFSSYKKHDIKTSKCRTLYECLILTENPHLQARIVDVLTTTFAEENWRNASLGNTCLLDEILLHGNCRLLQYYFPSTMTDYERIAALEAINTRMLAEKHQSLFEFVADNPVVFEAVLALYPKDHLLEMFQTNSNNIFNLASRNGVNFKALLIALPTGQLLSATKHLFRCTTFLQLTKCCRMDELKIIFECTPLNQQLDILLEKDDAGNTVLHILARDNPVALQTILKALPNSQRLRLLQEKNANGLTVLDILQIHCDQYVLSTLWLLPQDQLIAASLKKDKHGLNWLHRSVGTSFLKHLITVLPTNTLQEKTSAGNNILHTAAHCYHSDAWNTVWAALPESRRIAMRQEKNCDGDTPIHIAARHSSKALQAILVELTEEQCVELLQEENNHGFTPFHLGLENFRVLMVLLAHFPQSQLFHALRKKNNWGESALFLGGIHPWILPTLLQALPEEQRLNAITDQVDYYQILLNLIVRSGVIDLGSILATLPKHQHREALKKKDKHGQTALHVASYYGNLAALRTIVQTYSPEELLNAVIEEDIYGNNVFCLAAGRNLDAIQNIIMAALPKNMHLAALKGKNNTATALIQFAALHSPSALQHFLNIYPHNQLVSVIEEVLQLRHIPIDSLAILKTILLQQVAKLERQRSFSWLSFFSFSSHIDNYFVLNELKLSIHNAQSTSKLHVATLNLIRHVNHPDHLIDDIDRNNIQLWVNSDSISVR